MENSTGMATKYLLDMLNIGVKSDGEVEPQPSESQQVEQDGEEPAGEPASVSSSATSLMQTKTESEMSMSGILDGSTPRIHLQPVNQTIHLGGSNENGSSVYGNQVEIVTSQNTLSSTGTASNKIKFNQMVKYDWDLKYYRGNLIACGGQFIAYTLKGRTGYVIRLLSPQTASRALIKGFTGLVTDLAFAHRDSNTLACVDEGGNVYVWKIAEEGEKITYSVKLHIKRSERPISEYHKIFWCPYLPDDDDEDEESDDDDEDRSLAVTHDNQAEVIDVAMVIARCGCNEITLEMLQEGEGYVSIKDGHTKPITDGSLSPDNGVLATGSEDGYVRFWQIGDMMPDTEHNCLHEFQPHGGAPLSSLVFCDNHMSHEKDIPMWRFMITGAEYNREIKIWCTVQWTCLQTLRFTSPSADIENVLGGSYFKMQLDITARYLVMSDIGRRVLYVLLIHQNRDEGQAHITSVTDFQLTQSLLSFTITKAKLFQLKSSDQLTQENGDGELGENNYDVESPDELDESELDAMEKRKNLMVQLKLLSIHTKSLQELLVHLQPEPSVAPPTPSIISSLNTSIGPGVRDALSDLSGVETGTEASTDLEESDGPGPEASPSVQPKLITPDAFAFSSKDQPRPESSTTNCSSGTLVSPLNISQNSVEESVMSSVTSKLSDSTTRSSTQGESPRSFYDKTTGILTPTSLPLPGTPPFSSAPDPTTVPIPTFATSPISSRSNEVLAQSSRSPPGEDDVQVEDDKEQEVEEDQEGATTPTPASMESESQQVHSPASIKKEPFPTQDISKSFEEERTPVPCHEEDMDNTWMTATSEQTPVQLQRIKKLQAEAGLTSSPVSRVDIPPESPRPIAQDLSSPLSELLQLVKAQQQQIATLRQEVRSYQTSHHQNITELVRTEVEKLEDTLLERINDGLAQHSAQETQRLDKALKERQVTDKKKQEQLTSTLSQAVTNSVSGKLDKTLKSEMKNNVLPTVQKVLTPVQEQLNTTMAQKLTAADAVLKESVTKMLKNKGVVEAIGSAAAVALQGPLQNTYREALQNSILPGFERVCQSMFQQINSAFQKGTQQYLEKVNQTVEAQRQQKEDRDASMEHVKSQLQVIQRNSSSVTREVESVLQKQLATAMHSLREELTSRFESQMKLSVQETMKAEVLGALQDFKKSYMQAPVSESVPQQVVHDPKRRITEMIQSGNYAQAFQEALTAADLNLVVFVCESVDSNELFSLGTTPLQQPVLLSLIQQLSVDLLTNTELKHRYLTDAVMALDPSNEVTREHMPAVLQGLCQQLTYAIRDSQGALQKNLKMLHMAAQSLLR